MILYIPNNDNDIGRNYFGDGVGKGHGYGNGDAYSDGTGYGDGAGDGKGLGRHYTYEKGPRSPTNVTFVRACLSQMYLLAQVLEDP